LAKKDKVKFFKQIQLKLNFGNDQNILAKMLIK